jgi:hypothetical protein
MIRIVVLCLVCLISVWILPAQSVLAQEEEEDPIGEYARGMQIDYAEAERRLWLQGEMNLVEHKVAEDEVYFASWT